MGDSLLVISQLKQEWSTLDHKMMVYCQEIRKLENNFEGLEYGQIPQSRNESADKLAKLGSSRGIVPFDVFLHKLDQPSIKKEIARLTGVTDPEATNPAWPSSAQSEPRGNDC